MNKNQEKFDIEDRRLSLIDVSLEDDSLYSSPSCVHGSTDKHLDHESVELTMVGNAVHTVEDSFGTRQQVLQVLDSSETEPVKMNEKYNLRKSFAWDSAFFTSAGVLEPEELSSMIGMSETSGNTMMSGIEEELRRSSESLSTLASDNVSLETLESDLFGDIRASVEKSDLFGDIRASIEKANMTSNMRKSDKRDSPAQVMSNKVPAKNSNVVMLGLRKTTKQFMATSEGQQTATLCKPPKLAGRVASTLTTARRASISANYIKAAKEHAKFSTGRGSKIEPLGSSQNTLPRLNHSKLSLGSSMVKPELSLSSSVDSCGSLSSESSSKSITKSVKSPHPKTINDSKGINVKTAQIVVSRNNSHRTNSRLSPYLRSANKLPSRASPASSVSEQSPEGQSPTSKSSSSLDTVCDTDASGDHAASEILNFRNNSTCSTEHNNSMGLQGEHARKVSTESIMHNNIVGLRREHTRKVSTESIVHVQLDNVRPSGLRMPSPKIGFFDGVKTATRSLRVNSQSHQTVTSGLPSFRTRSASPGGSLNKGIIGKLQPGTIVAVRSTKISAPQSSLKIKSPGSVKGHTNTSAKISSASKGNNIPVKSHNRATPERMRQGNSRTKRIESNSSTKTINNPDSEFTGVSLPASNVCLSGVGKDVQNYDEADSVSFHKFSKDAACCEDQVDCTIAQFEAMDIHEKLQKERIDDAH